LNPRENRAAGTAPGRAHTDQGIGECPAPLLSEPARSAGDRYKSESCAGSAYRRLALCIAHQYIGQLDPKIADAILANCGTLISFRVGATDAPILSRALDAPEDELKDLRRGTAWVASLEDGMRSQAVPVQVPLIDLNSRWLDANIQTTSHRYARPRADVEKRFNVEEWLAWKRRKKKAVGGIEGRW
jgi:hypothetical protein